MASGIYLMETLMLVSRFNSIHFNSFFVVSEFIVNEFIVVNELTNRRNCFLK